VGVGVGVGGVREGLAALLEEVKAFVGLEGFGGVAFGVFGGGGGGGG
jgi:hypothetical protein